MDITEDYQITNSEVLIRQYGLLDPLDWDSECDGELELMDALWNNLIDIHEKYADLYRVTIAKDEGLRSCKIEYDQLIRERAASPAVSAAKKRLAVKQKEVSRQMALELRAIELARRAEVKVARQNSGLWWGNYNALIRAFESARSAAIRSGNSIRRRVAGGNGRITNTLQGGAAVEHLFDGSLSQVVIRQPPDEAWTAESRGKRRRLQRTSLTITIFVRSGERRNVTWPMIMHRPIPTDALVKNIIVTRRKIGGHWKWAASFTCTRTIKEEPLSTGRTNLVAIDVGWRRVPEGLRVATALAPGNVPRFIVLSHEILSSFAFVDELRERTRTSARLGIELLQSADASAYEQPFRDLLTTFQARQERKFFFLNEFCRSEFFTVQRREVVGSEMTSWRSEHIRLSTWLGNQQRKAVARRNHLYQNTIIEILSGISMVTANKMELREMIGRKRQRSKELFFPRRVDYYRIIAATSKFLQILKFQSAKRHIVFEQIEAKTPIPCPECGSIARKSRADTLPQICANCGTSFDQDVAACQLLLASAG